MKSGFPQFKHQQHSWGELLTVFIFVQHFKDSVADIIGVLLDVWIILLLDFVDDLEKDEKPMIPDVGVMLLQCSCAVCDKNKLQEGVIYNKMCPVFRASSEIPSSADFHGWPVNLL